MKCLASVILVLCFFSCALQVPIEIISQGGLTDIVWTEEELKKDIVIRHLERTEYMSTHLIRLQGSEYPHYHDNHDLSVTFLSGDGAIHFKDRTADLAPGAVIFVPKGVFHWAENRGKEASLVHVVIAPPFDGKDRRKAE